jgi:hypothetical protein
MKQYSRNMAFLCSVMLAMLLAASSHAETTPLVNYQGKLTKNGKNENGQINITFKVFTGATNNECVYEESQQISVVDGFYSTLIGKAPTTGTIEDACRLDDAYLEVSINNQILSPREKFCPPAFAQKSSERWNTFGLLYFGTGSFEDNLISLRNLGAAQMIQGFSVYTNCDGNGMSYRAVFPMPANQVTLASGKCLLTGASFYEPETGPFLTMQVTARTLTNSFRVLGPTLVLSQTNNPFSGSWFDLPLCTNRLDLQIQPWEMLCVEIHGARTNCAGYSQITHDSDQLKVLLDFRVK